jgi:hypothetical protein
MEVGQGPNVGCSAKGKKNTVNVATQSSLTSRNYSRRKKMPVVADLIGNIKPHGNGCVNTLYFACELQALPIDSDTKMIR